MSGALHTPGPWEVLFSQTGYPYQIHAPRADDSKAGAVGSSVTRWGAFSFPSSAEALANAHLIAAAPELLAALAACVDQHVNGIAGISPRCIERARAAIAKAEGRQ